MIRKDFFDRYRAYKLVKISDPFIPYLKGRKNISQRMPGQCELEIVAEADTIDELLTQVQPRGIYYTTGDSVVIPFTIDDGHKFSGLYVKGKFGSVCYHCSGNARIEGNKAFEIICDDFDGNIMFVIQSWFAEQINKMEIVFTMEKAREYYLCYELNFL